MIMRDIITGITFEYAEKEGTIVFSGCYYCWCEPALSISIARKC